MVPRCWKQNLFGFLHSFAPLVSSWSLSYFPLPPFLGGSHAGQFNLLWFVFFLYIYFLYLAVGVFFFFTSLLQYILDLENLIHLFFGKHAATYAILDRQCVYFLYSALLNHTTARRTTTETRMPTISCHQSAATMPSKPAVTRKCQCFKKKNEEEEEKKKRNPSSSGVRCCGVQSTSPGGGAGGRGHGERTASSYYARPLEPGGVTAARGRSLSGAISSEHLKPPQQHLIVRLPSEQTGELGSHCQFPLRWFLDRQRQTKQVTGEKKQNDKKKKKLHAALRKRDSLLLLSIMMLPYKC